MMKETSTEGVTIPVGLAVRICGFHTQAPGSTHGLGIILSLQWLLNATPSVGAKEKQKRLNTKETRLEGITVPVGLAVRICGFHPQGPGSTPALGIILPIQCR